MTLPITNAIELPPSRRTERVVGSVVEITDVRYEYRVVKPPAEPPTLPAANILDEDWTARTLVYRDDPQPTSPVDQSKLISIALHINGKDTDGLGRALHNTDAASVSIAPYREGWALRCVISGGQGDENAARAAFSGNNYTALKPYAGTTIYQEWVTLFPRPFKWPAWGRWLGYAQEKTTELYRSAGIQHNVAQSNLLDGEFVFVHKFVHPSENNRLLPFTEPERVAIRFGEEQTHRSEWNMDYTEGTYRKWIDDVLVFEAGPGPTANREGYGIGSYLMIYSDRLDGEEEVFFPSWKISTERFWTPAGE